MEKNIKYYLILVILICMTSICSAQQKIIRYEHGRKKGVYSDSTTMVKRDTTFVRDSILGKIDTIITTRFVNIPDSLRLTDSLKIDTAFLAKTQKLPAKQELFDSTKKADKKKFSFTHDTIPLGRFTLMSLIPGAGQVYNNQYWKVPVIYGVMGGFIAGGIMSSNKYNDYRDQWQKTIDLKLPQSQIDHAKGKMEQVGTTRTLFYAAAAATYLYQVADATFNYRGKVNHIRKATTLAMVFPGAGFIYTRTYWRLPIYYGGFITLATVIDYNSRNYERYTEAYNAATDNDPTTNSSINASPQQLQNARDSYRRNRDLGIIAMVGAYILSVIDTHVIATLKNWDISPDLSMTVEPAVINNSIHRASTVPSGAGLSLKIKF